MSNRDKGFTLIEMMVALAIVAIVSTPLLQMFVTTSKVNHDAQVIDKANTNVVQHAEAFKADPKGYSTSNGVTSYYFYNANGTFIELHPDLTVIPNGAAIMIQSTLSGPIDIPSSVPEAGYYPDFVGVINLTQFSTDLDVKISSSNNIEIVPEGSTFVANSSKITELAIPLRVDFHGNPRTINVINDSDQEAAFYIFNTESDSEVNIITNQGTSSKTYVRTPKATANTGYRLTLIANKLNKGIWVEMFRHSASANRYLTN